MWNNQSSDHQVTIYWKNGKASSQNQVRMILGSPQGWFKENNTAIVTEFIKLQQYLDPTQEHVQVSAAIWVLL